MSRPDARLLVPVECLPFVPDGARYFEKRGGAAVCIGFPCVPGDLLDLSAPALRDGVPERLDALPWALGVLGWKSVVVMPDGTYDNGSRWFPVPVDISDLSPDDASRAVVAAALRGGR